MPTLIADVDAKAEVVVAALVASGLHWRHPATTEIVAWNSSGERVLALSEADALELWRDGAALQLWRDESEDLTVGHSENGVRLYFDGCSAREVAEYLSILINQRLAYSVGPEE